MAEPGGNEPFEACAALTRRRLLGLALAGASGLVLPLRRVMAATAADAIALGGYLTGAELSILDAATAALVPTDERTGAHECGVVDYIQSLLSFGPGSDANCDRLVTAADVTATVQRLAGHAPECADGGDVDGDGTVEAIDVAAGVTAVFRARPIFGGGPFSGRNPQEHFPIGSTPCQSCHGPAIASGGGLVAAAGAASPEVYPPNAFRRFSRLTRLQRLSWAIRLNGADAVPAVANNPLARTLPGVDLRRMYRARLAELDELSQSRHQLPFVALTPSWQLEVLDAADPTFVQVLSQHTIEGMLCAPEYGGNRDLAGWRLIGFDGDSQPQGFAIYDPSVPGEYRERSDKPNSGPDPGEPCSDFSPAMTHFLTLISVSSPVQPGQRFAHPYCFGVET